MLHSWGLKFDVMHVSTPSTEFFQWNGSHRLAYWFTSPFLRFISIIYLVYRFSKLSSSRCYLIPSLNVLSVVAEFRVSRRNMINSVIPMTELGRSKLFNVFNVSSIFCICCLDHCWGDNLMYPMSMTAYYFYFDPWGHRESCKKIRSYCPSERTVGLKTASFWF